MSELTETEVASLDGAIREWEDHGGPIINHLLPAATHIKAAARAEVARDMRTKIEALADEWAAKADALAPDDGWGDTIGDTVAADSIRAFIAPLRALLADGGEPQ